MVLILKKTKKVNHIEKKIEVVTSPISNKKGEKYGLANLNTNYRFIIV